jgi:translation initiation factor 4E
MAQKPDLHAEGLLPNGDDASERAACAAPTADSSQQQSEAAASGAASSTFRQTSEPASTDDHRSTPKGDALIKHNLTHTWCLWALLRDQSTKDNWHGSQMNVGAFGTVEEFWRLFNHVRRPSKLGTVDFSLFKTDIHPSWEDEVCKNGGRWIAKLDKTRSEDLDETWLNLFLTIIGENFDNVGGQMVCGAVVSARAKGSSKVALWVSKRSEEEVRPIGQAFAAVLREASGFCGDVHFEDFSEGGKAMFSLKGRSSDRDKSADKDKSPDK